MSRRVIIFGAGGQDWHYLTNLCQREGYEVIGIGRHEKRPRRLATYTDVSELMLTHQPAYVFHLAANSTTDHSAAEENHHTIGTGTFNILESVYKHSRKTRVFLAGSGLQISPWRIRESGVYVAARNYSKLLAQYYFGLGIKVFFGYFFHHESPLRKARHVSQIVATAARKAATGEKFRLELGDLSVEKEWTFAGDMMEAVWTLVNQDKIMVADLGTGEAQSIEEWADECFAAVRLDWRDYITGKTGFVPEYGRLVANPRNIFSLGWRPKVSFGDLARMMVDGDLEVAAV